jgi:hypothetical protein
MNVFLSWSGNLSHEVAKALVAWVPQVIQAVKPWISSQDIEKGARWFEEIGDTLAATEFGILCLTSSNLNAPWLLFEAGALSKSLGQSRVCPLLINVKNADLIGPLAQFNTSGIGKDEIRKLVDTLNNRLQGDSKRSESQLDEAFQVWWPHLETKLEEALKTTQNEKPSSTAPPKRNSDEVLDEILELSRLTLHSLSRFSVAEQNVNPAPKITFPRGSVGEFATELAKPVEVLLEQLAAAGINKSAPGSPMTETDKYALLKYLQEAHQPSVERKKITLVKRKK